MKQYILQFGGIIVFIKETELDGYRVEYHSDRDYQLMNGRSEPFTVITGVNEEGVDAIRVLSEETNNG